MSVLVLNKLHFLRHPRTGSTAVRDLLVENFEAKDYGPALHHYYPAPNGEYQFTTVRNPYDVLATWFVKDGRCETMLDYLKATPPFRLFYMADRVDFVMLYDRLQDDFDKVMDHVGLPRTKIPRRNVTVGKKFYAAYWDQESVNLAAEQYEEDMRIYFGVVAQ